jgi:hypothetical protein
MPAGTAARRLQFDTTGPAAQLGQIEGNRFAAESSYRTAPTIDYSLKQH